MHPAATARRFSGVVIGAALMIAVSGCQPLSSPSPSQSASVAPPSGTPSVAPSSASASAGQLDITWTDQPAGGVVRAVTVDEGQFVAVGGIGAGPAAWTSSDGTTWQTHPVTPPTAAQLGVDPFSTRLLEQLVGGRRDDGPAGPLRGYPLFSAPSSVPPTTRRPVGWRTTDARSGSSSCRRTRSSPTDTEWWTSWRATRSCSWPTTATLTPAVAPTGGPRAPAGWQTTPTGVPFPNSGFNVFDLVWTGSQFVAVGDRGPGTSAVSFVSPTGQTWVESPAALSALSGASMRSVAVAPDGTIVAVGITGAVPQAFTSTDGLAWTAIALPGGGDVAHGLVTLTTASSPSATTAPAR